MLGPLRAFEQVTGEHVEAEPELVEAVLDEVATGRLELVDGIRGAADGGVRDAHIEAPFLQLVLERLWDAEREEGSDTLRLADAGGARRGRGDRPRAPRPCARRARLGAEGRRREHLRPSRHAVGDEDRAPRRRSRRVRLGRRGRARVGARDARARADPAGGGGRERRRAALRDLPRRARRRGAGLEDGSAARARAPGGRSQAPAPARDRRGVPDRARADDCRRGLRAHAAQPGAVAGQTGPRTRARCDRAREPDDGSAAGVEGCVGRGAALVQPPGRGRAPHDAAQLASPGGAFGGRPGEDGALQPGRTADPHREHRREGADLRRIDAPAAEDARRRIAAPGRGLRLDRAAGGHGGPRRRRPALARLVR